MPRVQSILRNNVDRCEALKIEQTIYFKMTVISKNLYFSQHVCVPQSHSGERVKRKFGPKLLLNCSIM